MSLVTLSATLPSEFVTTATAGTSADWLVIQKSGESFLSRIAATPAACGAAALAGSSSQNFACATLTVATGIVIPNASTIWNASYSSGINFATDNSVTFYASEFKCFDAVAQNWAPITAKSLYCSGGTAQATAFYFSTDGDTGISRTAENILNMVAGGTIQGQFLSGELASKNVRPLSTNTYALGNASYVYTGVWATDTSINTSDARRKADITDCDLGLDFIAALRPVSYRWQEKVIRIDQDPETLADVPVMGPGVRPHYGLIAQEVATVLGEQDFAGYIHDVGADLYALRYSEFIAPLIKAVQELTARVEALESA
jgi:hypothetical protein